MAHRQRALAGRHAARIHDNVVSQPLGQALFLRALGPVSVQGNALTSRGLIMRALDPSFWASAVWILNLGWSNEFYLQIFAFAQVKSGQVGGTAPIAGEGEIVLPGLDDQTIGRLLGLSA